MIGKLVYKLANDWVHGRYSMKLSIVRWGYSIQALNPLGKPNGGPVFGVTTLS